MRAGRMECKSMGKMVSVAEAKRNLEQLLQELAASRGELVIEQQGRPMFVVVALDAYEQKRRSREAASNMMRDIAERVNLDPEEADRLAEEAVKWARANKAR